MSDDDSRLAAVQSVLGWVTVAVLLVLVLALVMIGVPAAFIGAMGW